MRFKEAFKYVYEEFSELTKTKTMVLFDPMKYDLFTEEPDKITKLFKTIREAQFSSGMACVSLPRYIFKM